ncbi:DUF4376 domain-containing protein [Pseudomonas sp. R3.Fl]|uniref:DUF4376 domain-containing protein n=1 Tax=Pseudomonas TaxID=286 RepID=UPI00201D9913|nr:MULTISPECIES: DUF4376 domain-containing protein [Pseudomonas]MCL6689581.1 DUF4376 domain-containing protein [Pseudomonas sp. R3.Fl]MCP1646428.1 hypothetical protein [Pseudomonas citronellolis]MCP1669380.1 hypothetical protein [Pseudomonas citronellolis]MCP1701060.1 hypothetical protein [Pseudomonas citronellolis]MCP1707237.1 hypothetical protein [Pseudomonas citronellolis]
MIYFSESESGFYLSDIHTMIPADAIEISQERYEELLRGQSAGLHLVSQSGAPLLQIPVLDTSTGTIHTRIAARRWYEETRGIVVDSITLSTERESQSQLLGIALLAAFDPSYSCSWKCSSGFVELNAQQVLAIAKAVRAHVQACFDREAELLAHLEAGTFEESMLDQGWPA